VSNKDIYESRPWLKFYAKGVPADVVIPEKSVVQTIDETTEKYKDKTAVIFYGQKISYRELRDQIDRFATALCDLGVKKGDKVALLLLNSPQFIIAYFGALKAGAVLTAISPVYVSPRSSTRYLTAAPPPSSARISCGKTWRGPGSSWTGSY